MIKIMHLFRRPSPTVAAMRELEEAEHALLVAHSGLEWAQASVMYNQSRIDRLKRFLGVLP